jgi:hypothetical protein
MTQSQRWGKVVTTMAPTPNGDISTSQIWEYIPPLTDEPIVTADAEEATEEENDQA